MIVYFDTNIFIRGKYHLNTGKFKAIQNLMNSEKIEVIYTSATIGEIEKNLSQDLSCEVDLYNKFLKKEIPIISRENYNLVELDKEKIIDDMKNKVHDFFRQKGTYEIPLGQIEAQSLMEDYFSKKPPFEDQKPYEFKDAIIIYAIKHYYHDNNNEPIIVVSNDIGFLAAFDDLPDIEFFRDLASFLKYANDDIMQRAVDEAIEDGKVDAILKEIIQSLSVFCDEFVDFECEEFSIDLESASSFYIDVENESDNIDKTEKYDTVVADVSATINISSIISYIDEEASYYDKKEGRYLFEKRIVEERIDDLDIDIPLQFDILLAYGKATIEKIRKVNVTPEPYIEISEYSCVSRIKLEDSTIVEDNVKYCSQCGAIIKTLVSFHTYKMEPLCSNCIKTDSYGSVCPECGYKYPNTMMINGFCERCEQERD